MGAEMAEEPNLRACLLQCGQGMLGDESADVHSLNVAFPPELRTQQNGVDALRLNTLEDVSVWHYFLPPDARQSPQTSHAEGVELFGVPAVDSPCLACIEKGWEKNCPLDFQFSFEPQAPALPDLVFQSAEGRAGSG